MVVQFSVNVVSFHDDRSASATTTSPHLTMVSTLLAMRVLAFDVGAPSWLDVDTDRLLVPSVMPNPKYAVPAGAALIATMWVLPVSASFDAVAVLFPVAPTAACTA